jgi:hypothetical protein
MLNYILLCYLKNLEPTYLKAEMDVNSSAWCVLGNFSNYITGYHVPKYHKLQPYIGTGPIN